MIDIPVARPYVMINEMISRWKTRQNYSDRFFRYGTSGGLRFLPEKTIYRKIRQPNDCRASDGDNDDRGQSNRD